MAGVRLTHVAYKGVAQATTDLIAGQIQMSFNSTATALAHMQAGRVRGLGISTAARSSAAPGVPTIAESGLPGFEAYGWAGMVGPANLPRDIVQRLNKEMQRVVANADYKSKMLPTGAEPVGSTPEQFLEHTKKEAVKWGKIGKSVV